MKKNIFILTGATHIAISDQIARRAFTLAEVLITLAVIGIVATLTIPTLITKYQEKVTVIKVKKMYSVLSQAYEMYKVSGDEINFLSATEENATAAFNIFKPFLKVSQDCGTSNTGNCQNSIVYQSNDGKTTVSYASTSIYYKVILTDGSLLFFRGGNGNEGDIEYRYASIFYDINGKNPPNAWGKDLFQFAIYADKNRLLPAGYLRNVGSVDTLYGCLHNQGSDCTAWVIANGNMDYLHCPDELEWNTKTKCSK